MSILGINNIKTEADNKIPDNVGRLVNPEDVRETIKTVAESSFNRITDFYAIGLKPYFPARPYLAEEATIYNSGGGPQIFVANKSTTGTFKPADWDLVSDTHFRGSYISLVALQTALPTASIGDTAHVNAGVGVNAELYLWDSEEGWVLSGSVGGVTSFNSRVGAVIPQSGDYTTNEVAEGANLYYTSARFNTAFSGKTTTDLAEGTNLYYTSARFNAAFSGKTTTDLAEGTNLYYTSGRFDTAFASKITGGAKTIAFSSGTGALSFDTDFTFDTTNKNLALGAKISQVYAETGSASFTLTNGTTAINAGVITYNANTVIKVGDTVTGTGLASFSLVYEIISPTSARLSNHCISANTGVTFTVIPSHVGAYFKYSFTKTPNNQLGAAVIIEATSNDISRGLIVINRDGASSNQVATEIMAKGNHLWLTAPDNVGNLGTTWYLESGSGSGTSQGNFGFGKVVSGTRTSLFQITQGNQMQWAGTSSITSSANLGFQASTQVVVGKSNATVTPTSGNTRYMLVGIENTTSASYYWNPTTGSATLEMVLIQPNVTQSGSATGGVSLLKLSPVVGGIASGGYLRGFESDINDGTGTRHQLYLSGTANSYINSTQTGFGTLSPSTGSLVDFYSTTRAVCLTSLTSSTIATLSTIRDGAIAYQNDGTKGFYGRVNGAWVSIGGATPLRASKACTAEDGGTISAWSGTTDYTYTFTVTGAAVGQNVIINLDNAMASAISTNSFWPFAWVSAANTVKVRVRVATYVALSGNITIAVI
jgi:hypothetical protein